MAAEEKKFAPEHPLDVTLSKGGTLRLRCTYRMYERLRSAVIDGNNAFLSLSDSFGGLDVVVRRLSIVSMVLGESIRDDAPPTGRAPVDTLDGEGWVDYDDDTCKRTNG